MELPEELIGMSMTGVLGYLKVTYGEAVLAKMPDDLNELPEELKEIGTYHYFFGLLSKQDGKIAVPCASYYGAEWRRRAHLIDVVWNSGDRVVLLEN